MFRTFLIVAVLVGTAQSAIAQRYSVRIPTRSMQGEITAVQGSRLIWECDGRTGPIPYDRQTRLNVYASGDTGFVVPGAVVTVSGTLRPDKTIVGASLSVHVNPAQTAARPETASVSTEDPQINVKGRLVSLDPLVMKATDMISMVTGASEGRAGASMPPVGGAVLNVKLRDPKPESVRLILGSMPKLIAAGDQVTVTVSQDRPNVASAVSVRKSEVLKSGRLKPEKDGEATDTEKKTETDKPTPEKTETEKPETEKPESEKPSPEKTEKTTAEEGGKKSAETGASAE